MPGCQVESWCRAKRDNEKNNENEKEDISMRQIARSIARETMRRAGFTRINKKRRGLGDRSYFAINWREAVEFALTHPNKVFGGV